MTRHTLELRTIAALKNCKRGGGAFVRARYLKKMREWGYGCTEAARAWVDVVEVVELEMLAA